MGGWSVTEPLSSTALDAAASRFFGPHAAVGGPFALLGVSHEVRDPVALRAAVARRLAQIERHTLRMTPEAEELRLAVHTAAAQIADPTLHAQLIRHWPPGVADHTPAAWRAPMAEVSEQLLQSARMILGACGGWNGRAKRRLAHLARLHRVNANQLIRALRPRRAVARGSEPLAIRIHEIDPPTSTGRWWLIIHTGLAAMLLLAGTMVASELIWPGTVGDPVTSPGDDGRTADARSGRDGENTPAARSNILHHAALEQELRNALRVVARSPQEAAERAARSMGVFVDRWEEAPAEARERITGQFAAMLAGISASPDAVGVLLEPLNRGADDADPSRRAGAVALSALLRRSPGIPRSVRDLIPAGGTFTDAVGGFDAIAVAELTGQLTARPPRDAAAWQKWSDALQACQGASDALRTQARLQALELLVRGGVIADDQWPRVATMLANGLAWRAGDPARAWMIDRLLDPGANTARLAELTRVLATQISVPGLNASMVLAPNADDAARAAMASNYRAAWASRPAEESPVRGEALTTLLSALAIDTQRTGPADRLQALARASAAAAMVRSGDAVGAAEILALSPADLRVSAATAPRVLSLDDEWGARLIAADNPDVILTMLARAMQDRSGFSALAAEGVLTVAQQGGSRPVRDQARALVVSSAWDLQILLAIERAAARRPSGVVAEIVTAITGAAMPNPRDAEFVDRVRAVLLPRIAERMAELRPGELSRLEEVLAELMARRTGLPTDTALLRGMLADSDRWSRMNDLPASDRLSARAIESRRTARAQNAGARAQLVGVYHRALVESVAGAAVARAEIPRSTADRLLERMAAEWSDASTVLDQLVVSHRYEAELWRSIIEGAL